MENKTDYTILTKFRNKKQAEHLIEELEKRNYSCYNFFDIPNNSKMSSNNPAKYMKKMESVKDFLKDSYFQMVFQKDLQGLKNASKVIVLLPAGNSVHIEAGIAYGLGKKLILIGEIQKPESLYLIFDQHFKTTDDFLKNL